MRIPQGLLALQKYTIHLLSLNGLTDQRSNGLTVLRMVINRRARSQVIVRSIIIAAVLRDNASEGLDSIACVTIAGITGDATAIDPMDAIACVVHAGIAAKRAAIGRLNAVAGVVLAGIAADRAGTGRLNAVTIVTIAGIAADRYPIARLNAFGCIVSATISSDRAAIVSQDSVISVVITCIAGYRTSRATSQTVISVVVAAQGFKLAVVGTAGIHPIPPPVAHRAIADRDVILGTGHTNTSARRSCCFAWADYSMPVQVQRDIVGVNSDAIRVRRGCGEIVNYNIGAGA